MNNLLRGLIAGYGAKKLGGGCFSTVIIFLVLFWALGMCGSAYAPADVPAEAPTAVEAVEAPPPAVTLVPAG